MALAITGATGAFAPSAATTKTSAATGPMTAGLGNTYPYYHFTDAGGKVCSLRQSGPGDGPSAAGPVLEFVEGGQQGNSLVRLSQQNCINLVQAIVAFANTGTLS
jgi:hypothetical protein